MNSARGKITAGRQLRAPSSGERVETILRRAQEEDRARIARTIHDHLGLLLMLLRARLQTANECVGRLSVAEDMSAPIDAARKELAAAGTIWQQLWDATRQLQSDLRPAPLDRHGLAEALEMLRRTFAGAGLAVALDAGGLLDRRFSPTLETTAYWLTQHALTNVLRHSGADRATVTANVMQSDLGELLRIVVADAGKGFAVGPIGTTFGLTAMYDRAALVGGTVAIDSAPGRGTRVTVDLPSASGPSEQSAGTGR